MSSPPNQKPLDERLHEAAKRAEEELRRFVNYLDAEVVPEVRRNSSTALRAASVRLQKLAEQLDDARKGAGKDSTGSGTNPPPGNSECPHEATDRVAHPFAQRKGRVSRAVASACSLPRPRSQRSWLSPAATTNP